MKYLVQEKVVGDINFEIEASDMIKAVKLARKYIEDNHKDIFIDYDCFQEKQVFGYSDREFNKDSKEGFIMIIREDKKTMSHFEIKVK